MARAMNGLQTPISSERRTAPAFRHKCIGPDRGDANGAERKEEPTARERNEKSDASTLHRSHWGRVTVMRFDLFVFRGRFVNFDPSLSELPVAQVTKKLSLMARAISS